MHPPLSLPSTLSAITQTWSPALIASLNSTTDLKLAKIQGSFIWHSHPNSDELFYVMQGSMVLELDVEGGRVDNVKLDEGMMFVVPKGMRHRPVSEGGASIMMVEGCGTVNTGDVGDSELTKEVRDVRTGE
jgi:mannose-6-phosphate isomerase-like protein (cupin superfamily)